MAARPPLVEPFFFDTVGGLPRKEWINRDYLWHRFANRMVRRIKHLQKSVLARTKKYKEDQKSWEEEFDRIQAYRPEEEETNHELRKEIEELKRKVSEIQRVDLETKKNGTMKLMG